MSLLIGDSAGLGIVSLTHSFYVRLEFRCPQYKDLPLRHLTWCKTYDEGNLTVTLKQTGNKCNFLQLPRADLHFLGSNTLCTYKWIHGKRLP